MNIDDERYRDLTVLILDGLQTDGSHHKQYYLEEALKILYPNSTMLVDLAKTKINWEKGIAP